jgi:hypothetical protein
MHLRLAFARLISAPGLPLPAASLLEGAITTTVHLATVTSATDMNQVTTSAAKISEDTGSLRSQSYMVYIETTQLPISKSPHLYHKVARLFACSLVIFIPQQRTVKANFGKETRTSGLPRWVHRFLPPPPLRCAQRALRCGGGSLLWTTWTIRNAAALVGRQAAHRQITTDLHRHPHLVGGAERGPGKAAQYPREQLMQGRDRFDLLRRLDKGD